MKKRCSSVCLIVLIILMLTLSTTQTNINAIAASPPPKTLTGYIPSAVTSGQAHLIGQHLGTDQLTLAIGLPLRNEQALTQLLKEVSTPRNPHYRHYLTQAQANQAFNPTPQQEQQVASWLESHGLTVMHPYPNHLLVDVTGTFAQIEQLFHVTINDYTMRLNGKPITFYAPANEPTVDGSASQVIQTILGLNDYPRFHVDASPSAPVRPPDNGNAHGSPPYYPQDFANAYDVNPLWNAGDTGVSQHIGITLWGPPPSSAALQQFDAQTGATPPNLQVIHVDGGSKHPVKPEVAAEAGMDVEHTSGMAPGATIDYYEAPDSKNGNSTDNGLDDALNMAGTDANNNAQISNSWGDCEAKSISDPFTQATEQILQSNTVTGHDYFFASGDWGSACVSNSNQPCKYKDPVPVYPASSAYVTSVGGTRFNGNINGGYPGEVAWHYTPSTCPDPQSPAVGSGGGYSKLFPQPSWQAGFTKNKHRGYPTAYHDITEGTNGKYNTGPGWDAVTGLGSPDLYNLAQDATDLASTGYLSSVAAVSATDVWAVSDYAYANNGTYSTLIEHWNGSTWNVVPSPSSDYGNELSGVAAVSASDAWAVGDYVDYFSYVHTLTEQWNGSIWKVVPSPNS